LIAEDLIMRTRTPFYLKKSGLLATVIAAAFSPYAFALTPAGKIDFAFGKVTATGADGASRPLTKGAEVYSGDAIVTTDGRVQIRFSDGAYMALQPNTVFKVDQYAFEGKSDGKEKGSFSLVKGGLRTISGIIGKVNKQNYEIRTPTATIGIRGTAYSANQSDDGLVVSVASGLVSVSNQGGNVTLSTGQSVLVRTPTSAPEMTDQKAAADQIVSSNKKKEESEQQSQAERPIDTTNPNAVGDQRAPNGDVLGLIPLPVSGPGYYVALAEENYSSTSETQNTTANFSGKNLVSYDKDYSTFSVPENQVRDAGWDGVVGWGRWVGDVSNVSSDGSGSQSYSETGGISYVVGKVSPASAIANRNGTTVTYNLVGATNPSTTINASGGGPATLGTINRDAYVAVNFSATANMTIHATVTDNAAGVNYNLANLGSINIGNQPVMNISSPIEVSGGLTATLNGAFFGNNAERLGIAYMLESGNKVTTGAAAFAAGK
jgi:hypothetical protein